MRGERIRPVSGWESLTPTELRVVEQVAEGLTNPQIADALLMSRSTVKTHLVHVYAEARHQQPGRTRRRRRQADGS